MNLLWSILAQALARRGHVAVCDDHRSYTYQQLVGGALFMAEKIDAVSSARNIGIMLPTSGAFPVAMLGAWLARRVVVPINYLLGKDELAYVIGDCGVDTIITVQAMVEFVGGPGAIPPGVRLLLMDQVDFTGLPPVRWPPIPGDDDLACLLYTSGTSAQPKGVMLTYGNLQSNCLASIAHAKLTSTTAFLGALPQFHSFGLTMLTVMPLLLGSRVVYTARFNPKRVVALIREQRPEIVLMVPSMYGALLSVKEAGPKDFASVHTAVSGGERLPNNVFEAFERQFGVRLLEGYGLTETSPVLTWATPALPFKPHSVGPALPGVTVVAVDRENRVLPPGADGEIVAAGPGIMKGYYRLPAETAAAMVELNWPDGPGAGGTHRRFFRTGDIGHLDDDGFLFITGRMKEMLKVAGEIVVPREVEEVLCQHPSVQAAAVIGKSDGMRGEVPVAFVEIKEGQVFDEAALRSWCRDHLAGFKNPREVRRVDQLPRSPAGKVLKRQLRAD